MKQLYSVSQSIPPYDQDVLVGHELPFTDALRLLNSLQEGVNSMFPSYDITEGSRVFA